MELNLTTTRLDWQATEKRDYDNTSLNNTSAPHGHSKVLYCLFSLKPLDIIIAAVLYTIVAIGGSLGNTLVLLVIKRAPKLKTVCGVFIANLAIADLLVTAVAVPMMLCVIIQGFVPVCSLNASMFASILMARYSCGTSLLILVAMSVDRCWAICCPLHHKIQMTFSKVKAILLFIWLFSLILPILEGVTPRQTYFSKLRHLRFSGIAICYIVIVSSGIITFRKVRNSSLKIRELPGTSNSYMHAILHERNKQVAKTVTLIVVVFSICWVPFSYVNARFVEHHSALHFWSGLLSIANSAMNPYIYFYREKSFRQALKDLFNFSIQPRFLSVLFSRINLKSSKTSRRHRTFYVTP
ncbi:kappa-type opioid receptor-like [Oculina patagonica]